MTPVIELKNVCKTYPRGKNPVAALRDVSLTVAPGELLAITGSSGSGKSTLMNILGCLDLPDSGSYRLNGTDVLTRDEKELSRIRNREIGFIFQGFHLIPTLTALENVELPLVYRGLPRSERRRLSLPALRGPAAAGGHRPGHCRQPAPDPGRRAHREPGHLHRPGGDERPPFPEPGGPHRGPHHPRPLRGRHGPAAGADPGRAGSGGKSGLSPAEPPKNPRNRVPRTPEPPPG